MTLLLTDSIHQQLQSKPINIYRLNIRLYNITTHFTSPHSKKQTNKEAKMDFVNKAKDAMKGSSGSTGGGMGTGSGSNTAAAGGQKEDFGDKGMF